MILWRLELTTISASPPKQSKIAGNCSWFSTTWFAEKSKLYGIEWQKLSDEEKKVFHFFKRVFQKKKSETLIILLKAFYWEGQEGEREI